MGEAVNVPEPDTREQLRSAAFEKEKEPALQLALRL